MARNEHIDTSHKDMELLDEYALEKIQEREQLWKRMCKECGTLFDTKIKNADYCGTCTTVANVLFAWEMVMAQRWNIIRPNRNPIVEKVAGSGAQQ